MEGASGVLQVLDTPLGHAPRPGRRLRVVMGEGEEGQDGLRDAVAVDGVDAVRVILRRAVGQKQRRLPVPVATLNSRVVLVCSKTRRDAAERDQDIARVEIVDPTIPRTLAVEPRTVAALAAGRVARRAPRRVGQGALVREGRDLGQKPGPQHVSVVDQAVVKGGIAKA